ncbi:FAD-dependent oxidoreductase, partial [Pediococcus acidilactici]|uniref:FAD-dependent oxidoreductase n=1 Tax=Pediococcus acidilactici TaxID=1254 RepID=UPI00319777F0
MFDVAVIGAGLAGLVCAQQLTQAGYNVVVVEKSRGLGGRVATRRVHGTCADHGLRYLEPKSHLLQQLVQVLCERNLLQVWNTYEQLPQQQPKPASKSSRYVAPDGMS